MSEQHQPHQFTVELPSEADSAAIGQAQLDSWRQAYLNPELGIDAAWIDTNMGFLAEPQGNDYRRQTIREAHVPNSAVLYLVAKDPQGQIRGFVHATRREQDGKLDAIYLTEDAQGTGVAEELMERVLAFVDEHQPIEVEVANYNARAIHFYEKYGFKRVAHSTVIRRGKVPVFKMVRQPDGGGTA